MSTGKQVTYVQKGGMNSYIMKQEVIYIKLNIYRLFFLIVVNWFEQKLIKI